ncbi:uncharacterized protein LOC110459139 isoform X2 [Mizuhopecten yessoensis]|uniref:RING-type E3 ubiquitin transferase n=1 Tax=Mizuhopecten yessoensis TaxID=6573 RepID=A0A210Q565_MIZYE|nr:uncharacterized protein LOC110459139 isoform X2 [Mizuhopecten yessoensis]OWF43861.1 E3 ubiquitin-protein ligase DTX3L [Mizuhopecten yessoensis]
MATGSPSDQEDCNDLSGGGEADSQFEVSHSPPVHCDEDNPKSSLDFSMISSGSSSFEILTTSTTASMEIQPQDFDTQKSQVSDQSGLENEDLEKLKDVTDKESCKTLSESVGANLVKDEEDEEPSQIKHVSLDGSLVVLSQDDIHNSVSEVGESTEIENKHGLSENKTTSEMNDEDGHLADEMETRERSLGESLVVLGPEDFDNSLSSEVNPQHITDRMIAGLVNSTDDLSHGEDEHLKNVEKTSELTRSGNQEESIIMKEKTETPPMKDDFIDVKDKKLDVSIVDIPYTESTDTARPDSTQHQNGEINGQKDSLRKQGKNGEFDKDDCKRVDSHIVTAKDEEDGENTVPSVSKKEDSVSPVTDSTLPEKLDNAIPECGPQDNSLIGLEPPGEIAVTVEVSTSDVSTSYSQEVRTNIDSNVQQIHIPEHMNKPESIEEKSKDSSLSESLVVIERDEVVNALQEEASERDPFGADQEDDSKEHSYTSTGELNLIPVKEGRLDTIESGSSESKYKRTGKTDGQPPVELTHKVIGSILESMPSLQMLDMNEQASGGYHRNDVEDDKDALELSVNAGNYQRNKRFEGSGYSTDSFCVLSDSMSESFQNSETKVKELQSNFIFTGADLPVVENFVGVEGVSGGDDAIGLHYTNDTRNMAEKDAGNTTENENDPLNIQCDYIAGKTNETEGYLMDPHRLPLANNPQTKDGTKQGTISSYGASLDRMAKVSTKSENEEENDSSDDEENVAGRILYETSESDYPNDIIEKERSFDYQFPSLSSVGYVSVSSFEVKDGKGASKYLESSFQGASEESMEHSTNESKADSDKSGRNTVSTLDVNGQVMKRESGLGREENELSGLEDASQICRSSSLQDHGDLEVDLEADGQDENDFSDDEENVAGRKLYETSESDYPNDIIEKRGRSFDYQLPSLSSVGNVSISSFEVIYGKGGSKYLESSFQGASEESMEHSTNESKADSDKSGRNTVSTLDVNGQLMKGDEQKNVKESGLGREENESSGFKDASQICRSPSLQDHGDFEVHVEADRQEENDMTASVPANEHDDEPNASTFRTEKLQLLQQNDPNRTEKVAANLERENMLDGMKKADEGILDVSHHQSGEEKEKEEEASMMQGFPAEHHDKENNPEARIVLKESVLTKYRPRHSTDATNYTVDEPVETGYVPLSLNHKNGEEDKVELTKDLTSLEDLDLLKAAQDQAMVSEARKNLTDERTALYEQHDTKSDAGQIAATPDTSELEAWNNLDTPKEQDLINHELNGPNIIFQNASSSEADKENDVIHQGEEPGYMNRKAYNDETGTPSMESNQENQQIQPSASELKEQTYDQEEEEDDTTLTMESTENASQAQSENEMETEAGKEAENNKATLEWYNEPVSIYVLREWVEYEDQKHKVRKDQQPITKDWITIEKVKFLFLNFRLSELLKTKLPSDTSVSYDDLRRHMHISNNGPPFRSDEEYRKWWLETIQGVFLTVDTISAYLCNLDNITREASIESFKKLPYANVRVIPTEIPETFLVLGTANVGSILYNIQSLDDHHQLVKKKCMTEVRVNRMSEQWTRWCRHLAEDEDRLEEAGILDIFTNEDDGHCYVNVEKHNQLDIENVLERSSQQSTTTLEDGEYKLLSRGDVKKYIDDNKLSDITNHWRVREDMNSHKLIVLADNREIAEEVTILIKSSVKRIDLKRQGTEHHKKLQVIARQCGGKLYWLADEATRMINVFITDDILEQVQGAIEELLGGRKSASIKGKAVTKNVHLDEYDRIKFLDKYVRDSILQLRNALKVTVSFQNIAPDQTIIKISGEEECVQAAHTEIQTMVDDIKSFQHPNVELFVPDILIDKVRDLENVNRCVIATHFADTDESDDEQLTFDNFTNRKTVIPTKWWTCGQARIGLAMGPVSSVEANTIVNMMPRQSQTAESTWKPTIFVPHADEGKAKHDLSASFKLLFEQLSRKGDNSVAIDLRHCCDWSFQKFLKVTLQAIKELWSPSGPDLGAMDIVLAVPTDEVFQSASATIIPVFQEPLGLPMRMVQDRPQVLVIKGDITKEQTDVIVNTAQKDLDLSHGAVSKALASRAGSQLQRECKKSYPKGLRFGQLAITGGHMLDCQHIFHGAFDLWPWNKRDQKQAKEILGKFVTECLEKADELRMSSISFPAVGTGNLGYPASVVAEEMLKRIWCFMKNSKLSYLKKVRIVIYPTDKSTFKKFMEENSDAGKQDRHQHKVHFRVACSAADQMILVRKIDAILSDALPKLASSHDKYYYATDDLEPESSQRRRTEASSQRSGDEPNEDLDATLKGNRSETAALHYVNVTSDVGCCVIVRGAHTTLDRTVVWNWLESDVGVTPVGIAWPYRYNVCEALVTCASTSDAEKVLRRQSVDFKATTLEIQILFNVRASIDPQFSSDKREIRENSGVTVDADSSGICQLVGNLPQIEAANEFIVSKLRGHPRNSVRKNASSNDLSVDGITKDVYNAFSFFFQCDPSYNRYKDCMNSMKYSEVDRTMRFDGRVELGVEFQRKLAKMKTDITCDQIDVEGRHFKVEEVKRILISILDSQCDVHVSIPQEDTTSTQEMKVINLIGLDRNKVQAMKYQVLESIGMTNSRRNRRFDVPSFLASRKPDPLPILPPPPSAKEYHLGDKMKVLAYEGNILYLRVDGIVNAANKKLNHGGGVACAISEAADIQRESTEYVKRNGKVPVGTSCHTSAGNLKHYKYIIHTVGPRWDGKNQSSCEQQLQDAITSCILKAEELQLESVAIPAISAGIFSMPSALCVQQYCLGVKRAWSKLKQQPRHFLKEIHFVDKDATILLEIQKAFDHSLEGSNLDPPGHAGQQIQNVPYFDKQGARPKECPLHPFKEFNNRGGIDKTTFVLSPQARVHVYTCDILATRVDAVVCGQDKFLQCKSKIAARIQKGELSGQDFSRKIVEIKQKHRKQFKEGEVFCIPILGFDTDMLLVTICPSMMVGVKLADCKDGVKKCVQNILNKANEMKLRSIALPVLGSGNDVSKTGVIAKVIVESILKFFLNPQPAGILSDIHFVNHDQIVTKAIVKMFDDHVSAENARIRKSIQPKVYPGMAQREGCLPTHRQVDSGRDSADRNLPEPQSYIRYPHEQVRYPGDLPGDRYQPEPQSYIHYPPEKMRYPGDQPGDRYPSKLERNLDESDQHEQKRDYVGQYQSEQEEDLSQHNQSELGKSEKKPVIYEDCVICIDSVTGDNVKTLPKCNHSFHPECIDAQFKYKPVCPTCGTIYGVVTGNQPRSGTMKSFLRAGSLPGFEKCEKHFHISYSFPDGIQESEHPYPGKPYRGTMRTAYLPNNSKGKAVHEMLMIAFKRRLTFTIGHSRTTGEENVVTWNDIHHKTNKTGGQQQFGYPDPGYLGRVTDELAAKGVTEADIK